MSLKDLMKLSKERRLEYIDLKFVDIPGLWQHITIPIEQLSEDLLIAGIGFDGSSIRGFQPINESDMLLKPDPSTAFVDPFMADPTLSMICNVKDPLTQSPYSRDPRYVAYKAERYLSVCGIADQAFFGPEPEFYIFDDIRFDQSYNRGFYHIDSREGFWNTGRDEGPNLGYKPRYKEGYFPVPPTDSLHNLRAKMCKVMTEIGIPVILHHHEVATAGQCEIGVRVDTLVNTGDTLMKYKYVVKNVALANGKTVTFMPKPLFQDNGSGMHVHQSLWRAGRNLFYDPKEYGGLSRLGRHYVGGLLHHAPSLLAFTSPTTNSYRRLVPGYEAPINLVYSMRNRSACVRIPMYSASEKAKRIEFRCPDCSCNPYLALAAMLMAGLDGIENEIEPPPPIDEDIYELSQEEKKHIKATPGSLAEVLDNLERDHSYLLKGGVFTEDLIEVWIDYKRRREDDMIRLRPHPYEFALYFDI
ncbi:MAG: type I glutamate--ammonia ligase [Syntrophales bacterium]|nr:type I glutamate--ammonia ligase [Syntrophales bacterium]